MLSHRLNPCVSRGFKREKKEIVVVVARTIGKKLCSQRSRFAFFFFSHSVNEWRNGEAMDGVRQRDWPDGG